MFQDAFPSAAIDPVDVKRMSASIIELMSVSQKTGGLIPRSGHLAQGAGHFPQAQGAGFQMPPLAVQARKRTEERRDGDVGNPAEFRDVINHLEDIIETRLNGAMGIKVAIRAQHQAALPHGEQGVGIGGETPCPEGYWHGSRGGLEDIPANSHQADLPGQVMPPQYAVRIMDPVEFCHFRVEMQLNILSRLENEPAGFREVVGCPSGAIHGFHKEGGLDAVSGEGGQEVGQPVAAAIDIPVVIAGGGFDINGQEYLHDYNLQGLRKICTV